MNSISTSGDPTFSLDLNSIAEEAFERCGEELRSGYDLRTARRSLNLLLIEWANRGVNLWTVKSATIDVISGQGQYVLPDDIVDIMDCVYTTPMGDTFSDFVLTRIPLKTYIGLTNKALTGRPTQYIIDRQAAIPRQTTARVGAYVDLADTEIVLDNTVGLPASGYVQIGQELIRYESINEDTLEGCIREWPTTHNKDAPVYIKAPNTVTLWPVPYSPTLPITPEVDPDEDPVPVVPIAQLRYWYLQRMDNAGEGGIYAPEIPYRFLPAMTAGLAFYMASKLPRVTTDKVMLLKQEYEEQWALAATEDREKTTMRLVPRMWGRL